MTAKYIEKLTPEQLALIPIIRDEWIRIALDTTPIDKQKAEAAICLAYECAQLEPPQQILWFDNPLDAATYVTSTCTMADVSWNALKNSVADAVLADVCETVYKTVSKTVSQTVRRTVLLDVCHSVNRPAWNADRNVAWNAVRNTFGDAIKDEVWDAVWNSMRDALWNTGAFAFFSYFDAIGVDCSKVKGLFATAKHCGWWWAFKDVAVAIPKPSAIRLDDRGRLHGEGVPAVAYQGFNVYAYHGVRLPEKYGSIHPEQWQSQWLLEEDNAELKRVLIQGIGYDRICQELQAVELDSWQEYTLLRIDSNIDVEPIYLLKMTCPSTGYIHALRVPPDVATARDAIIWVNWGIAPEEFAVQT